MAEKTKDIETKKEASDAPVADIAEEIREEGKGKVTEGEILEDIDEKLEKSEKKKEFEAAKKTAEAHGTLSEEKAKEKAKDSEKVSKEMIEKSEEPEKEESEDSEDSKDEEKGKQERKRDRKPWEKDTLTGWEPKTKLGEEVQNKKIKDIDEILENNKKILEEQIVDTLLPDLRSDLISIGQSKGKFGGGKRRAWRQTQRKTQEGNIPTFSTMAVVGDENGHVGIGVGKSKETLPARDKAVRKAKLNVIEVARGCSAFDCSCNELHTIPFEVEGKSGSVRITLIPAPQGTGLVVANELKKVLTLAGIKDVYSKTFGKKRTSFNLVKACMNALKKTTQTGGK